MVRHRDDLLEQIREPLWDRIDRRLAVVLAISISAHLALAIASWLADPPVRPWLLDESQAAYTAETIDTLETLTLPAEPDDVEPGTGVVAPTAPHPPAPAQAKGRVPGRTHLRVTPAAPDAAALVGDLIGPGPSFRAESRRVGKDLDDQIDDARDRAAGARIGKGGAVEHPGIGDADGPDVGGIDGPSRTDKPIEVKPPRIDTIRDPETPVDYEPGDDMGGAKMHALQRCYQQSRELSEGDGAKIRLAFTLGVDGGVTRATATGPRELAACVAARVRAWKFPVTLPRAVDFAMNMMFVPH